jgi:CRP-like cAMP-binding protein
MASSPVDSLWGNIFKKNAEGEEDTLHTLKNVPIFSELSKGELKIIERIVHPRKYQKEEVVFNEGEPGVGMYIIQKGSIGIRLKTADGSEREIAVLKDGDFFGELALLDEEPRSAAAVAKESTQLLGFFHPDLFELLEEKPKLGNKIILKLAQIIGERLRHTNREVQKLRAQVSEQK